MVDFTKFLASGPLLDTTDPLKLFESLDRRATHTALRPVQAEALQRLAARRAERDLVLKLSTGAGKTTVALIHLYSHMAEKRRPAVYLCPTTQLVEQVMAEAQCLGIPAVNYPANQPLPGPDALAGRSIVVCTYDKLFNAKTTFDRDDVMLTPCALVLDDAHAGIDEVRSSFTMRIEHGQLYDRLIAILGAACKEHEPGPWSGIEQQDPVAQLDVPFWIWASSLDQTRAVLAEVSNDKPFVFVWGYLRDHLRWCRCIISGSAIEIFYDVPAVHLARAFREAQHRIFMSGTLSDDSALARDFGCSIEAARSPIVPPSDGGVGERMVLAPSLIDPQLNREWVMQWCSQLSNSVRIAVLASSEKQAREWEAYGATVELGSNVSATVDALRRGQRKFVAFAQRYDGVDLPDDACRVLVLDGMPKGQSLAEDHDRSIPGRPGGALRRTAYRIEQGMGRAVRSHADYAVVMLVGPELSNFLAKAEVLEVMSGGTRAQLALADELVRMARMSGEAPHAALGDMAVKCITRDPGWKALYDLRVRQVTRTASVAVSDDLQIRLAQAEAAAQRAAMDRDTTLAAKILQDVMNDVRPSDVQQGWLLQRRANYVFEHDRGEGLRTQK